VVEALRLASCKSRNCQTGAVSVGIHRGLRESEKRWRFGLPGAGEKLVALLVQQGRSANEVAGALISMMGRSQMLQSKAGYINARPLLPTRLVLLRRTARPYIVPFPTWHPTSSRLQRLREYRSSSRLWGCRSIGMGPSLCGRSRAAHSNYSADRG
jgi:hypothetical protein